MCTLKTTRVELTNLRKNIDDNRENNIVIQAKPKVKRVAWKKFTLMISTTTAMTMHMYNPLVKASQRGCIIRYVPGWNWKLFRARYGNYSCKHAPNYLRRSCANTHRLYLQLPKFLLNFFISLLHNTYILWSKQSANTSNFWSKNLYIKVNHCKHSKDCRKDDTWFRPGYFQSKSTRKLHRKASHRKDSDTPLHTSGNPINQASRSPKHPRNITKPSVRTSERPKALHRSNPKRFIRAAGKRDGRNPRVHVTHFCGIYRRIFRAENPARFQLPDKSSSRPAATSG